MGYFHENKKKTDSSSTFSTSKWKFIYFQENQKPVSQVYLFLLVSTLCDRFLRDGVYMLTTMFWVTQTLSRMVEKKPPLVGDESNMNVS